MGAKISDEAINAINTLKNNVNELHKDLLQAAKDLLNTYNENQDGLGNNNAKIEALLNDLVEDSTDSTKVKKLTRRLTIHSQIIGEHKGDGGTAYNGSGKGLG